MTASTNDFQARRAPVAIAVQADRGAFSPSWVEPGRRVDGPSQRFQADAAYEAHGRQQTRLDLRPAVGWLRAWDRKALGS
jgi:hypothetical protein